MIRKYFLLPNDCSKVQLFRYIFSGVFTFSIDFIALFIFTEYFGIYYLLSAVMSFILGLLASYIVSIFWIFSKRSIANKWFEFSIFATISLVGLTLNTMFMWIFTDYVLLHYLFSKILSAALVFVWNFSAKKIVLFR